MKHSSLRMALWKGAWVLGWLALIGGAGYFLFSASGIARSYPGNPIWEREQVDPAYAARQEEARAEDAYFRKRTRYWLEQISNQEGSLREAACEVECRGWWDTDAEICRMQLKSDPTASKPEETRQVHQCV